METNENEDTTVQNLWDTAKVFLRGTSNCNTSLQKIGKNSNTQANLALKELEKEHKMKPTPGRSREIMKI